nr:BREX-2 system phosphatase PglZ [Actinopolymorpha pittospori]
MLATPALVRSKVTDVLQVDSSARVIALLASPSWTHEERVELSGGRTAVVRGCVSTLAVRDALDCLTDLSSTDILVLLTELESAELGDGIKARVAGQRVLPLDRWHQLMSLFRARVIDPGLTTSAWAVDALLAHAPGDGYPAVRSGYLDKETAFVELSARVAGLSRLDLDLAGLLQWTLDPAHVDRWKSLDETLRDGLSAWLAGRSRDGRAIGAVLSCLSGDYGADTVAVGLVLSTLTQESVRDEAKVPRTMLETRALGSALDLDVAAEWGRAAEALVQRSVTAQGRAGVGRVLHRAEEILAEQNAVELAHASGVLDIAFAQRITHLGTELARLLRKRSLAPAQLAPLEAILRGVRSHALVGDHAERERRAVMAVRLTRWLAGQRTSPAKPALDLAQAARRQESDDAWVDVARARVWEGDVEQTVGAAYRGLCEVIDGLRAGHEERFARLLADHAKTGSTLKNLLPVEDVLADVVVPLGNEQRILLLVLDGMSTGVAHELLKDLTGKGWVEHGLEPERPVISVLPSITRVSRTSLLTGRLSDGSAATEKAAFQERGWPLFHKGDLSPSGAGDALAPAVLTAIKGTASVVGVVVNTVDDTLDKGGRTPWSADSVDRLLDLLTAGSEADRVALLVSDHGHVHERGSRLESDESGGARFRTSPRPPSDDEVELTGSRVLLGGGRVVAPWNEKLRYAKQRNGYHGGASAQEVVIPLALLARAPLEIDGWHPRHHPEPDWWVGAPVAEDAKVEAAVVPKRKIGRKAQPAASASSAADEGALFTTSELAEDSWIDRVLASEAVTEQLRRVRRGGMPADRLTVLLRALDAQGGAATRTVIARALDIPEGRVVNQVAAAQRVVNLDGYEVLKVEGDTIRLNAALLRTQAGEQ